MEEKIKPVLVNKCTSKNLNAGLVYLNNFFKQVESLNQITGIRFIGNSGTMFSYQLNSSGWKTIDLTGKIKLL